MQSTTPKIRPLAAGGDSKPWYAYRWPWLVMLGPLVAIVAGVHLAWIAFAQQDALVVDDYYKQGKAINQDLRRDAIAAQQRTQLQLAYDAADGKLEGRLTSTADMANQDIQLLLVHPTLPQSDRRFQARTDPAGRFQIALPLLQIGHWQVQVEDQQRNWRLTGGWIWPQEKQIEIKAAAPAAQ